MTLEKKHILVNCPHLSLQHQTTEEKVMAMKKGALGVKLSKPAKIQEDKFKFIFNKDNQDVFRMICKLKGFN